MEDSVLNLKYYKGTDLYSDGDIEDTLLELVTGDEPLDDVLKHNNDWAILYHLSKVRHNLLEWYDFKEKSNLLEIGSGCGAITSILTQKVDRVVCIELSKRRSQINAARNQGAKNLEIMVGNFEDIVLEEKFDYVTLIGVLEYAQLYIQGETPFLTMLKRAKSMLKPSGKLIIAIENRFGLKYWAGASEDHTGRMYDGLEGYEDVDYVKTFSRPELSQLLNDGGFEKLEYYYPMPDYKMPMTIYSDQYLPKSGELRNISNAYDRPRMKLFNEELVYDALCKDGQFPYFANSFLVIAE